MKKIYILLLFIVSFTSFSQVSWQGGTNPDATSSATILFDKTGTGLATYSGTIYAHTGVTLNSAPWQNVKGTWANNTTQPALTLVSGNIYKLDLTPSILSFYNVSSGTVTKINIVFRNAAGSAQSTDLTLDVGAFQTTLTSPVENSTTIINSGQNLSISASNTNGNANYNLLVNGVSVTTASSSSFNYTDSNITINKNYELQITQGATSFSKKFNVIVNPGTVNQTMASGLEDGINYNSSDTSKATLVLNAPGKDFVYVAGSFNDWQPGSNYAMKKDASNGRFWIELNGLTAGTNYTYQYWVVDQTPSTNSPALVKTADPFSTLVLSPFDDPYIPGVSYPNMPVYPAGQEREVTVLQTGQTPYAWSSATTNFVKPNKDNLVVYEVLIRDFDSNRNFQDLINKIDYFKNLNINAIELMPVMEFEGNESWGYNTSFHMALDKFYGTENKFKEFIDLCHQNGIAVILDVALNHSFGRNPMVRMWMKDADGDGWGDAASDNPYYNEFAKHSYGVGNDFNHITPQSGFSSFYPNYPQYSNNYTNYYTKRVVKHWIQEFKIDGFRWDLTKGFTQACSAGDDNCTNMEQPDRVAILKEYADYSWSLDNTQYVIFEHLGVDSEEQKWANYRIGEGKGIMMWGELTSPYTQLAEGYSTNSDITRMGHVSRGFTGKRLIGYPESHDKDRLVYSAKTFGNGAGAFPVNGNVTNSVKRMSAIGAISLLIPGPKMIWHFAELGMDNSIFTCNNGSVNSDYDTTPGDCKLDTKPQPQWTNNWLADPVRGLVYTNWAKMIALKKNNAVFNANYSISGQGGTNNNVRQRIYLYGAAAPLSNVVILSNFSVANLDVIADFPFTGTWYNLMDNTTLSVTNTAMTINIDSGGFRIYGNAAALGLDNYNTINKIAISPNPSSNYFSVNSDINKLEIYSITGQLVKKFENQFENYQYSISDLNKGVYLIKVVNSDNQEKTMKLIKQ